LSDSNWHAFHLYYYDDRDRVLLDVIRPVVRQLLNRREIDSFFFIRYGLGGPHVRLRLQVRPGAEERVAAEVERAAHRAFDQRPSRRRIEPERLARATARISLRDPAAGQELEIQPDNSLRRASFEPETERYGGSRYLPASLGLFALSSATVLRHLCQIAGGAGRGRLLAVAAETLWRQALGYAGDSAELARLLAYSREQWGQEHHPRAAEQAAEAWERQQEALVALALREIERRLALAPSLPLDGAQDPLAAGSLLLSRALGHLEPARRIYIGWSHLHMTANRLGLRNSEEILLSALLGAALEEASRRHPETVGRLDPGPEAAGRESSPPHDLSAGLGPVLQGILDSVDVSS
jgi:thiopeptide-type bacteriocin biosynthesis protein